MAVVSYAFSQEHFGGAVNAAGQSILINNLPFTVVGVTPPEFFGVDPAAAPDVYLPMHANELLGAGHQFGFRPEDYLEPELLLDPGHGPVASRRQPRASPSHAGAGVSAMGSEHGRQ